MMKELDQKAAKKVSFRQKEPTKCPVCSFEFFREEMLTGGGRLIAGKLTDELRRLYDKNEKFGKVYPMAYILTVCPRCLYTSYSKDFNTLTEEEKKKMQGTAQARINSVKKFFGDIDFREDRNLVLGAASYLLAVDCYSFRRKEVSPTFKNAMSSVRAAWLFDDLSKEIPEKPYKKISDFFYRKAYGYYMQAIELAQTGGETLEAAGHIGPDTDKNWSYEGLLYMCAVLTVKVAGQEPDPLKRIENYEKTKKYLSRLFGVGKSSKSKPGALIDMTRDLYDRMSTQIEEWKQEAGIAGETESP